MEKAYVVIATAEAKSEKVSLVKQLFINVINPSQNERTCLEYRLHQDLNNPAKFILYERWTSKEAHQNQFQKPYILEFIKNMDGLLATPPVMICAEEISIAENTQYSCQFAHQSNP